MLLIRQAASHREFDMKFFEEVLESAVIWRTSEGEKKFVTPSGWPLTKKARELAERFDRILAKKMKEVKKKLRKQGYFKMETGLPKYHLLGKALRVLDDLELLSKCDPDRENIWRALYDYVPKLAPRKMPASEARTVGKRNFFLNSYRLGQLSKDTLKKMGTWSNWEGIYMVFAGNPKLWEDWERLLSWILKRSSKDGKIDRRKLRGTLKVVRKTVGKRAKVKRDTTVLTDAELYELLDAKAEGN
jgi:hypothetical protein